MTSVAAPSWVDPMRDAAAARFAEMGFPTTREEEWRKTSVAPIARTKFLPAAAAGPGVGDFASLSFEPRGCSQLVFINGRYTPERSTLRALPAGVVLCSLHEAIGRRRDLVEPHLGRLADHASQPFTALNMASMQDGFFLFVPEGAQVDEPIHLLFVTEASEVPVMTHPRNLIIAGNSSRARLVESYAGTGGAAAYFTNTVTEIALGGDAEIDHYKVQRESEAAYHVSTMQVRQERSSRFTSHSVSLGAALSRHDVNAVLAEEGAECTLNGLYMTAGRQHVDFHTSIDHAKPNCVSRELYKGVLDGRSRGVFSGKIIVRPDARGTDSIQANRNLLLSGEALVDTKPELQIFNNDVKCKHAATIGQLDEAALFYLRSRALGREAARSLLIHAFVSDIVGRIKVDPLRESLEDLLLARLPEYVGVKEAAL